MKSVIKLVVLFLLFFFNFNNMIAGTYSGGTGAYGNPYIIASTADLIELSKTPADWISGKYFEQSNNITFDADYSLVDWDGDGSATWDEGDMLGFSPIGNFATPFKGNYEGVFNRITNLYINRSNTDYVGLFGYCEDVFISNIRLINSVITGQNYVGRIVGKASGGQIMFSYSMEGSVTGTGNAVGGLAGYFLNCTELTSLNCYNGSVTGSGNGVGGVVGISENNFILSYNKGDVTGGGNGTGGLVGININTQIENGFNTGNVNSSGNEVGGLVGINQNNSIIRNSFCVCDVSRLSGVNTEFGGFCGHNYSGSLIEYCYSAGYINFGTNQGFVGSGECTNTNNFFDKDVSNQISGIVASAKTTGEMKTKSTFTGWDFESGAIWHIIRTESSISYPYLLTYQGVVNTPTNQSHSINFNNITNSSVNLSWTSGNGTNRVVFMKEGGGDISNPLNNITYYASNDWNNKGSQLESSGYYCVYKGDGSEVDITNLKRETQYTVQIFEYNATPGTELYNVNTAANNPYSQSTARYYCGIGTAENPYQIKTVDDLLNLTKQYDDWSTDKYFIQIADIAFDENEQNVDWDWDGSANWDENDQLGFNCIGNYYSLFWGNYDGQNHSISNVYINQTDMNATHIGFFGDIDESTIQNLVLENIYIRGDWNIGGLVGGAYRSTITNCRVNGEILAKSTAGGFCGWFEESSISNCYSSANVSGISFDVNSNRNVFLWINRKK